MYAVTDKSIIWMGLMNMQKVHILQQQRFCSYQGIPDEVESDR